VNDVTKKAMNHEAHNRFTYWTWCIWTQHRGVPWHLILRSMLLNIVDQNLHTVFHRSAASRKRSSIRYHDEKQFCGDVDVRRYRFSTLIAAATHSPNGRCSMR